MSSFTFSKKLDGFLVGSLAGFVFIIAMWLSMPNLKIYWAKRDGQAKLAHSEFERQTIIQDAHAKLEASKLLAQAEIERAKGVAQSNQIIADGLKNNENYIKYLWIHSLENTQNQVIYVPTEAGLPVLESGKRK